MPLAATKAVVDAMKNLLKITVPSMNAIVTESFIAQLSGGLNIKLRFL